MNRAIHIEGQGRARRRGGFTLLEMLLAISLAAGLLFATLYFYRQSADLRDQLISEVERVSAARLILERLTAELRAIPGRCYYTPALSGSPTLLQFIKTAPPSREAWTGGALGRSARPETDLRLVNYTVSGSALVRTEEAMVTLQTPKAAAGPVTFSAAEAPAPGAAKRLPPLPLTDRFASIQFRFYDGSKWLDSWTSDQLPRGVEISLWPEAPSTNSVAEEAPAEVYRRVVFIPSSGGVSGGAWDEPAPAADPAAAPGEPAPGETAP